MFCALFSTFKFYLIIGINFYVRGAKINKISSILEGKTDNF